MYDFIDLFIDICLSVIDNLVIGQLLQALLRPLAMNPRQCLLTTDMVALHHPLDAYLLWCRNHDVDIGQSVETALKENGTLHPFDVAGEKIAEHSRVDNGINRLTVVWATTALLRHPSAV